MERWATATSPRITPSTCSSVSPLTPPSMVVSDAMSEATFGDAGVLRKELGSETVFISLTMLGVDVVAGVFVGVLFGCLLNIFASLQEAFRVLQSSFNPNLVVKARSNRAAGGTDAAQLRADGDALPNLDVDRSQVAKPCLQPVATVDFDNIA